VTRLLLPALIVVLFICLAQTPEAQTPLATLSLAEAYALTEANAEALRIRGLAVEKDRYGLQEARSRSLPRVSLKAAAALLANPPEGITVRAGELGTLGPPLLPVPLLLPPQDKVFVPDAEPTYFSFSTSLTQPVYTWGKIAAGILLADLQLAGSRSEWERQRLDLRREVHQAYFTAQLAGQSLPVLAAMRDALSSILADRERSLAEGLGTHLEVLDTQAELAALDRRTLEARETRDTALAALRLLTGELDSEGLDLRTPARTAVPAADESAAAAPAPAAIAPLSGLPEVKLSRIRLEQARQKLKLEKAGAWLRPDLSLSVTLEVSGQQVPFAAEDWRESWDWDLIFTLGTEVKLFDAGQSAARIGQARADAQAAELAVSQEEKLLRLRLRRALQAARQASAELREREARLAAAEERLRNAQSAVDNELAARADLEKARLGSGGARLEEIGARLRLELALAELERLAGTTWLEEGP
jgi:outer membrane protein TolC